MDISRLVPRCALHLKKLTLIVLVVLLVIYMIQVQNVCTDPDLDNIHDRYLRKLTMIGKVPANGNCQKQLPKCIIIGVMKGGTEAFSTFLALHPQVAMQFKMKATLFFTDINYKKGTTWYLNQMPCSMPGQITIEKSPQYWPANDAPSRIYEFDPDMKLIVVVREPIARAMSQYLQQIYSNPDILAGKTFEEAITDENGEINVKSRFIQVSEYAKILQQWLQFFKREQILIIDGNTFNENPVHELKRTEKFLNLTSYINRDMFVYNKERNIYCIKSKCGSENCLPDGKGRSHPDINPDILNKLHKHFNPLNQEFFRINKRDLKW